MIVRGEGAKGGIFIQNVWAIDMDVRVKNRAEAERKSIKGFELLGFCTICQ